MKTENAPTSVPADPEQWSASSKKSLAYQMFAPEDYADIHYFCRRCGARALYSALEQRQDYEVLKVYIWRRRLWCEPCWTEYRHLKENIQKHVERWRVEKTALQCDKSFLDGWLRCLLTMRDFRRTDEGAIVMLQKLIGRLE